MWRFAYTVCHFTLKKLVLIENSSQNMFVITTSIMQASLLQCTILIISGLTLPPPLSGPGSRHPTLQPASLPSGMMVKPKLFSLSVSLLNLRNAMLNFWCYINKDQYFILCSTTVSFSFHSRQCGMGRLLLLELSSLFHLLL